MVKETTRETTFNTHFRIIRMKQICILAAVHQDIGMMFLLRLLAVPTVSLTMPPAVTSLAVGVTFVSPLMRPVFSKKQVYTKPY